MAKQLYYAVFSPEDNGQINISFPDLSGCLTFGENMSNALSMAKDALEGHLLALEDIGTSIPTPADYESIEIKKGELVVPIEVDTYLVRVKLENRAVKKTLTIPYWLDELAKKESINFSHVLQEGLKNQLGIHDNL